MSDPETPPTPPMKQYNTYPNLGKLLSGRFILTVVGAFCFYIIVDTICQLVLDKKEQVTITEVLSILSSVLIVVSNIFTFYFVRKGMGINENSNGSGTEE